MAGFYTVLAVTLLGLTGVLGQVEISMDISKNVANPGETVSISCRVQNMPDGSLVKWYKEVVTGYGPNDEYREFIANNQFLAPPYNKLPRYTATMTQLDGVTMLTLTINGVTHEDSGHIGCSESTEDQYSTVSLTVIEPPMVTLTSGPDNTTDKIFFNGSQPVYCKADNGNPRPRVRISIDGFQYTKTFNVTNKVNAYCTGNPASKMCPLHLDYDVIVWANEFMPTNPGLAHGKMLTCEAIYEDSHVYEKQQAQLEIVAYFKPELVCRGDYKAELGRSFTIKCDVRANPFGDYEWKFEHSADGKKEEVLMRPGDANNEYLCELKENHIELKIMDVSKAHFTTFTLKGWNEYGEEEHTITLNEYVRESSSAVRAVYSGVLLLVIALLFH